MKTQIFVAILFIIPFFLTSGCSSPVYDQRLNQTSSGSERGFGIYLTENNDLVISEKEIEYYNISSKCTYPCSSPAEVTHQIKLTLEGVAKIKSYQIGQDYLLAGLFQKTFIVRVNGKEKYRGAFWSYASSQIYPGIVIIDPITVSEENPILHIQLYSPELKNNGTDLRSNEDTLNFFRSKNKLIYETIPTVTDPWSSQCTNNTYAIYGSKETPIDKTNYTCQSIRICDTDLDCSYLTISGLPPRYGKCESRLCQVYCGSGIIKEC